MRNTNTNNATQKRLDAAVAKVKKASKDPLILVRPFRESMTAHEAGVRTIQKARTLAQKRIAKRSGPEEVTRLERARVARRIRKSLVKANEKHEGIIKKLGRGAHGTTELAHMYYLPASTILYYRNRLEQCAVLLGTDAKSLAKSIANDSDLSN